MCSATVLRIQPRTSGGARSRSSCCRPKACRRSTSTRKRDTMHLPNKQSLFPLVVLVLFTLFLGAQNPPYQTNSNAGTTAPPQYPAAQNTGQYPSSQDAQPQYPPAQQSPNQPGDTVQIPAGQGQAPDAQSGDVFVFKKQVEEVQLHATVVDDRQRLVTNLDKNAFAVYEDGKPQQITSFRHEDIPVALGIVIDNSGSMRDKRPAVNQAALNLVRASNPNDQVFIVNFNDEYYLDQDYTPKVDLLKEALEKIDARGGTALYDAIVASADHLKKSGPLDKKVLLVVTDGEDNASRESLEQAIRRLQDENGPTVYTIGLLGEEKQRRAH